MRLGVRVSGGNSLAESARRDVTSFFALGAAAVQYWSDAFPFPTGAFGPLLEHGIDPSLGWELMKAATYPQTCAFGQLSCFPPSRARAHREDGAAHVQRPGLSG